MKSNNKNNINKNINLDLSNKISNFLNKNDKVTPLKWVLPNKKEFVNWVTSTFVKYRADGTPTSQTKNFTPFKYQKLLRDYKTLIKILNENKMKSINLDKKKEDINNYKSNIYVKHQNAMLQLCRETPENIDTNEMTDHIIKYIDLFKKYADRWINEYYIINKNNLTENIEKQEIKLLAYRNLFINTTKEIIPLEKISKNICPICFDNEINMCAVPCGHTCCNECVMQSLKYNSKLTKCLNCRNTLKEYIKLFIQL